MDNKEEIKILIVDDLDENLIALSAILKIEKYQVFTARSGAEALKKIKETDFDIFLLDVQMPGMNGYELAANLKKNLSTKETPIIFLTAYNDDINQALKGYNAGALDYIIKPVNTELLFIKIDNFIRLSIVQKQLKEANKKLLDKAKNSSIFFEALFFHSPDEIFILNENGIIVNINRSGKLSMGAYASELIGKHFSEMPFRYMLNSELNAGQLFETIMYNGVKSNSIGLIVHDDNNKRINYEISGSIFHTGELERFLLLNLRDVTKKVEAEEKTRQSENFTKGVLNSLTSAIAVIDKKGRILQINAEWAELSKSKNSSDLLKANTNDNYLNKCKIHSEKGEKTATDLLKGIKEVLTKQTNKFQTEYVVVQEGRAKFFLITVTKYWDDSPLAVIRHVDITKEREMERKLLEKNKELELFMYRASHDLKGPLSTSKGILSIALDECRNSNMAYYLNLLKKSNAKLENILSDLMEIVLIREGSLEKNEIDISELIKDIVDVNEKEIETEKEINLIFDINVKEKIFTDTKLLKIALRNVFNNAVKYSKKDYKNAYINTSAEITNGYLQLTIADNGIGIPDEFIPKVFDMFFRATDSSSGTGLGLYITKNAIDKLNGDIMIESKYKTGTTVIIKIPYQ